MQTQVKDINNYTKEVEITLSADERKEFEKKAIKKVRRKAELPGFRKGRVPEALIIANFGYDIANETLNIAMDESYPRAIESLDLPVVAPGQLKDAKYEDEQMILVFDVEVEPTVELEKVEGLELEKTVDEVTDAQVEEVIARYQEEHATIEAVDGGAEDGHEMVFDMQQMDESGVPVVGKKYENQKVTLGKGQFDEEMEKQLLGMKTGEKKTISKQYGDDAPDEFKGKKEVYEITVKEINKKELPEVNDDFAKLVNEKYNSVEEMRVDLRKNMEAYLEDQLKQKFQNDLIEKVLDANPFDVPKAMVDHYLDHLMQNLQAQYGDQFKPEMMREAYRPGAERTVKWFLVRDKLIEEQNIEVTEEEIDAKIDSIKDITDQMREDLRKMDHYRDRIKLDLQEEKVLNWLEEKAVVKVVKSGAEEKPEKTKKGTSGKSSSKSSGTAKKAATKKKTASPKKKGTAAEKKAPKTKKADSKKEKGE